MASPAKTLFSAASGAIMRAGLTAVAATALTITDFADLTHYQRDTTGLGKTINVSITTSGSPTAIEWRAVDYYTGAQISPWTTLVNNPGASATVPIYMPASKWAKIQVRDSVNNALTATTTARMAVGIKWLTFGQSNMFNRATTASVSPTGSPQALIFTNPNAGTAVIKRIGNYNDNIPVLSPSTYPGYSGSGYTQQVDVRGDSHVYFASLLAETLGMAVMLIERAKSGSSINDWLTSVTGDPWDKVTTAITAVGGDFEGATYHQGETDAVSMSRSTRLTKLATLHARCHALNGRNSSTFKLFFTTIGTGPYNGSSEGQFGVMREADNYYARTTAGAYLATSAHDTATGTDTVHIDGEGYGRIGRREVKSVLAAFDTGVSGAGPRITTASRSGTQVSVPLTLTSGTAITDGAGGSGSALTGFRFFDAGASGAQIAVTGSSISGNTILLTLASTPVGALTMDYAMTNVPHGTAGSNNSFVPASCVYDNATYYNSTIGCPLQPCSAITVT